MRALVTDWGFEDLAMERKGLAEAGIELAEAQCRTAQEVIAAALESGARAFLVQMAPINAEVLQSAPELGMIARYGVGVDNIDLEAARQQGITVCNVTGYADEEVATHAAALALSLVRGITLHDRDVRTGGWDLKKARPLRRSSLMTLGIVGFGRIGQLAAHLLAPFFGKAIACDPYLPDSQWPDRFERVSLDELLACSDVLSLHLPLNESTRNLIDERALASVPAGAIVVNTARGGLIDEDALLRALESGQVAGAGLDVLATEPPPPDHPLRRHPRALVTPHAAWYATESEDILRAKAIRNVVAWARGERPDDIVVDPVPGDPPAR